VTYFFLPSRPDEAAFLTVKEKEWIAAELGHEARQKANKQAHSPWRGLSHRHVWHLALISFAFQIGQYALFFFMPQAVRSLPGVTSNSVTGVLVMIPYAAGLLAMIFISRRSDHKLERRYHVAIPAVVGGLLLMSLGSTSSTLLSVVLWSVAAMGIIGMVSPFWSLPNEFLTGVSAASGIAVVTSIGSLGGFVGPSIIGVVAGGAGGLYWGLALAGFALWVSAALVLLLPKKMHQISLS